MGEPSIFPARADLAGRVRRCNQSREGYSVDGIARKVETDHDPEALEYLERVALQRVVRVMREEAASLPSASPVAGLLDRSAKACLGLIPSSLQGL